MPVSYTHLPGQDSVRIPIQNDFDFTNLSSVKMAWSVREDENVLYSGTDSMYGLSLIHIWLIIIMM